MSKSSLQAPAWLAEIGLDAYEYQCGRGIHIGEKTARSLGEQAAEHKIVLSLHAPYFINLSNPSKESLVKNTDMIVKSCRTAAFMSAGRVVVHSGTLMGRTREEALKTASASLKHVLKVLEDEGLGGIALCPETMGKINQLGNIAEVLALCGLDESLVPCIDFGHIYARRRGKLDTREQYEAIMDEMQRELGNERAGRFHCHFSKVEYTEKGGEMRHLNFSDPGYGPNFEPFGRTIAARQYSPTVICESAGEQSVDALAMKRTLAGYYESETTRSVSI